MTSDIEPFHAAAISKVAHAMAAQGLKVIHMEFGQPSTGAPKAAIERAHAVLDAEPGGYWESGPLKHRLARHYAETYGVKLDHDQVIITCGASPALVLALTSAFRPGDRIALARPGYVAYRNTLKGLGMVPVEIACGEATRYQLDAATIAALEPAPAGVIIASPANPTGSIVPAAELKAIAEVCRARGVRIVSDEIYHGLSYGEPTPSMLAFEPSALVVNSFSKYFSMVGWRLGWLIAPQDLLHRARALVFNMFLTAPSLSQHAGLAALDAREELDGHVEVYRRNRELLLAALPRLGLTEIAPPDGAFYVYADIRHLTGDSLGFCKQLLKDTGVATAPGIDFDPVEGGHHFRMSFAVSTPELEEAIERMVPWFAKAAKGRAQAAE